MGRITGRRWAWCAGVRRDGTPCGHKVGAQGSMCYWHRLAVRRAVTASRDTARSGLMMGERPCGPPSLNWSEHPPRKREVGGSKPPGGSTPQEGGPA
jgi:hypothetical protein